jgi:hypothetical protein
VTSNILPAIAGTEQEVEARADLAAYTACMMRGDENGCNRIEAKYGLFGLSPQRVSEELAEIAASQEPQI